MPLEDAIELARAVGVHRIFRRAGDRDHAGSRYWLAALTLQELLRKAQDGDKASERQWIKACGLGPGRRPRGRTERWARDQAVRILTAPSSAERRARLEDLFESFDQPPAAIASEPGLAEHLTELRKQLHAYDSGRRRKPLAVALGDKAGRVLLRAVSKKECYVLLDLLFDITKTHPRDKKRARSPAVTGSETVLGERIRKWATSR